jgi:nucleotide-binding universal stress UspA family protein
MFNQIVVGVDGRGGGRDAIALAMKLRARDSELTLAHIHGGDRHADGRAEATSGSDEREHALELLETARQELDVKAHLRWRVSPSVGRGLHELCERIGADLLVVGSTRRGLVGRVLIGDDTRAALNGAPCALAIAPAGYSQEPVAMREIGVGYDGSAESECALRVARELAAANGAKLSAFEAVSLPTTGFAPGPSSFDDSADGLIADAVGRIAALGAVEAHAAYGEAAEELAVYSASLDLLIVGSRGYGPIGRLIHGSTSHRLVRRARCPLVVLPRLARAESAPSAGDAEATFETASPSETGR